MTQRLAHAFTLTAAFALAACEGYDPNAIETGETTTEEATSEDALVSFDGCNNVFDFMDNTPVAWATFTYSAANKVAMSTDFAWLFGSGYSFSGSGGGRATDLDPGWGSTSQQTGTVNVTLERTTRRVWLNGSYVYFIGGPVLRISGVGINANVTPEECTVANGTALIYAIDSSGNRIVVRLYNGFIPG
jgi:hypothetical protein